MLKTGVQINPRATMAWIGLLLGGLGFFLPEAAAQSTNSRFYDFTDTVIRSEQKVPGLEFILGRPRPQGRCDGLEADEFRLCLGEVRDVFRYVPRDQKQRVDVMLVSVGQSANRDLWRISKSVARGAVNKKANTRMIFHPPVTAWPLQDQARNRQLTTHVDVSLASKGMAEKLMQRFLKARMAVEFPYSDLRMLGDSLETKSNPAIRPDAYLGLVVFAREHPALGEVERITAILNGRYGPSGWGATVVCEPGICPLFQAMTQRSGGRTIPIGSRESRKGTELAVADALWQTNRWNLSFNPGLSGFMELRSSNEILKKGSYAYDPFERRVRVSGSKLPFDQQRSIEVWYFPFNPLQALAKVCPQAVERRGKRSGALPCKNWMANEVTSPRPHPRLEIRVAGATPVQEKMLSVIESQFEKVAKKRNVELAWRGSNPGRWRADTFRVLLCFRDEGCEGEGADAVIPWIGGMDLDTMETTAWRTLNRSTEIPVTGTPIVYDTLKVYLNGRAITETTKDGAGYVLRGDRLFLDVAAPLHPDSHVFVVYKSDRKRR